MPEVHRFEPAGTGPLDGVRILDLSRLVAGNILTHALADMGADVIKVEPPSGDSLRAWKLNGVPVQWKVYGRNKRSIMLDLKAEPDKAIFRDLIATAQVLVENFRPGVLDRLGFGVSELWHLRPGLIVARITGWGQTGPYRDRPGFGTLVEAASGFAFKNGFPDRPPLLPNLGLADSIAGLYGAAAVLAALREVEVNRGAGQEIDLSLLEPILSILGADQAVCRVTGAVPTRTGNRTPLTAPRNVYRTLDGHYLALSASTQEMAFRLFRAIGRPELCTDPEFSTNERRVHNVAALDTLIGGFIASRTRAENLDFFQREQITVGPVNDAADVMDDPHVIARGAIIEVEDADLGSLPMHDVVPRFSRTPGGLRHPAPELDEHRAEILRELGRSV
jgi:crotonobetainyl-CoA:carnitine CoA-transferase CaiB-like acyl-CoA transferase